MINKTIKSDLARLDAMTDADIDYSDNPPLDDLFFEKLSTPWSPSKKQLTIRLDEDVLAWIKAHGKGYQSWINFMLCAAMDSQSGKVM